MREPGEIVAAFPRPGKALKAVLAIVASFALAGAIVVHWVPGPPQGAQLFEWLAFQPRDLSLVYTRPWTLLTSGVLTNPEGLSHALWALLGLYFLTPDLERRWGGARLLRFLALSVVVGNLSVLAVSLALPVQHGIFHPALVFGPLAAVFSTTTAWALENKQRQIRLMFFIPVSGKTLLWVTVGFAVLSLVFAQGIPEGAMALFGGIATGLLFGGSPSPVRHAWLRLKLAVMRRRGGAVTVESVLGDAPRPRAVKRRGGPPLRVVPGGLEDELKNRKPPKDKRYLN